MTTPITPQDVPETDTVLTVGALRTVIESPLRFVVDAAPALFDHRLWHGDADPVGRDKIVRAAMKRERIRQRNLERAKREGR